MEGKLALLSQAALIIVLAFMEATCLFAPPPDTEDRELETLALVLGGGLIALNANTRGEVEDSLAATGRARVCILPNTCVLLTNADGQSRGSLESFMGVDITSDALRDILSNLEYSIDPEKIELRIPIAAELPGKTDLPPIVSDAVNGMIGRSGWFSGLVDFALELITGFKHAREILDHVYLEFRHSLNGLTLTFHYDGRLRLQALLESEFTVDSYRRWDSGDFKEYMVRSSGNRMRMPIDIQARVDPVTSKVTFERFDLPVEFQEINLRVYHFKNLFWPLPDYEENIRLRARLGGRALINPEDLNRLDFGAMDEFCLDVVVDVDADIRARLTFGWRGLNSREELRVCL